MQQDDEPAMTQILWNPSAPHRPTLQIKRVSHSMHHSPAKKRFRHKSWKLVTQDIERKIETAERTRADNRIDGIIEQINASSRREQASNEQEPPADPVREQNYVYQTYKPLTKCFKQKKCTKTKPVIAAKNTAAIHSTQKNDTEDEDIIVQIIDLHVIDRMIYVFGIRKDLRQSIVVRVEGFYPHVYLRIPPALDLYQLSHLIKIFNRYLGEETNIIRWKIVRKKSLLGYCGDKKQEFLKLVLSNMRGIYKLKSVLSDPLAFHKIFVEQLHCTVSIGSIEMFETKVDEILRFSTLTGFRVGSWIRLNSDILKVVENAQHHCKLFLSTNLEALNPKMCLAGVDEIASFLVASVSVQFLDDSPEYTAPSVRRDKSAVLISTVFREFSYQTTSISEHRILVSSFAINVADENTTIFLVEDESALLKKWKDSMIRHDPDIILGFGLITRDLPLLLQKARYLGITEFAYLGRLRGVPCQLRTRTDRSGITRKAIDIHGRIVIDLGEYLRGDTNIKMQRYTLTSAAQEFLDITVPVIDKSMISTVICSGTHEEKNDIALRSLRNANITVSLFEHFDVLVSLIEMSRVTGVSIQQLLYRGQQYKVFCQLFKHANEAGYIIPDSGIASLVQDRSEQEQITGKGYQGATVIEATKGYYKEPIATLDFAALYPSIIIAHNMSYETYLKHGDDDLKYELDEEDMNIFHQEEGGKSLTRFVHQNVQKGILPMMLESLLKSRAVAKEELKRETNKMRKSILNGRQLALKISCNSVYGFCGASKGFLPCFPIASTVTFVGRKLIEATKLEIEHRFSRSNGFPNDCKVIYGDTDSVMINFKEKTIESTMKLAHSAISVLSKLYVSPIKLEFEKVYCPYMLLSKKRYAGLMYTNHKEPGKIDVKGLETVRRDNCALVKDVMNACMHKLLIENDINAAIEEIERVVTNLKCDKVSLEKLLLCRKLSKLDYKTKMPQVEVRKKMIARGSTSIPELGDRIFYVILPGDGNLAERAEDPLYAIKHNLCVDTSYYLQHQLKNPLENLFSVICPLPKTLWNSCKTRIAMSVPRQKTLHLFLKPKVRCTHCKAYLKKCSQSRFPLCSNCEPRRSDIRTAKLNLVSSAVARRTSTWSQCTACIGSHDVDQSLSEDKYHVLSKHCKSVDCDQLYIRYKTDQDLFTSRKALQDLNIVQ